MPTPPASRLTRPSAAVALVAALGVVALMIGALASPPRVQALMSEQGPFETVAAAGYFVAALALLALRDARQPLALWLALAIVMTAFGLRELDLHKAWTEISVLKSRFWIGAQPLTHKAAALAVLAPVAWALWWLARHRGATLWRALRERHPVAVTAAVFLVTLVLTKAVDRGVNILSDDLGVAVSARARALGLAFEEVLEMALALLVLLGLGQHRALARRTAAPPDAG
ncbi:hypothetical protein [Azohydromonas sp.]|uniref:hypothetical protein n=1 Tax=Azohydromonas sp. TaxID=1872666 RepID=UPI002BA3007B|nr:hypothetical protein [Azohydromonas sp.]HMM84433.1 hypothetical protein [Azohydromonas sp.]